MTSKSIDRPQRLQVKNSNECNGILDIKSNGWLSQSSKGIRASQELAIERTLLTSLTRLEPELMYLRDFFLLFVAFVLGADA